MTLEGTCEIFHWNYKSEFYWYRTNSRTVAHYGSLEFYVTYMHVDNLKWVLKVIFGPGKYQFLRRPIYLGLSKDEVLGD
jgi:hypothetical protein